MLVTVPFKKMYSGDRPVIVLDNGLSALIDTGAENNVWYTAGNLLKHIGSNICMDSRRKMKDADNKTVYLINNIWTQEAGSSLTQESETDGKG